MEFKLKALKGYEGFNAQGVHTVKPPVFKEFYETTICSDAGGFYGKSYSRSGYVDEDIINSYPKEYKKFKEDLIARRELHEKAALYELEYGKPYVEEVPVVAEEVKQIEEAPQSPELKEVAPVVAETLEAEPEATIADLEKDLIKEKKKK